MSHIVNQIPSKEINSFFSNCSTIGGYIIFPAKQVDKKMTINASRGLNRSIVDRFDLTLECIRRFYINEDSPLSDTFKRYSSFSESSIYGSFPYVSSDDINYLNDKYIFESEGVSLSQILKRRNLNHPEFPTIGSDFTWH